MASYVEDLVQQIYTKCDMSGLDKLNQGLKDAVVYSSQLEYALRAAQNAQKNGFNFQTTAMNNTKQYYTDQINNARLLGIQDRERIRTKELQLKSDMRLADMQERMAQRQAHRDEMEHRNMLRRNRLWRAAIRFAGIYFSFKTVRNIVQTGSQLQLLQQSIQGLTGGTQDWQFITDQAYKFGVSIKTVATGYRNFYSSAKMAGVGSKQIQQMYSDLLLSTRAIGADSQQTGGALLALEQMYSKGKVSMEELRRQLGNSIPGAFEIGAKAMNMTTQQFNEFVKKGGLASADFIPRFIKTLKEVYAGGWKEVEQTVSVAQGQIGVAWEQFTKEFMHGEIGKPLAQAMHQVAELLRSKDFADFVSFLGEITKILIGLFTHVVMPFLRFTIKHIGSILILLGTGGLTGIIVRLIPSLNILWRIMKVITGGKILQGLKLLVTGFAGLNTELLPIYGTILAIIAAILILQDIWTYWKHPDWESYTKDLVEGQKKVETKRQEEWKKKTPGQKVKAATEQATRGALNLTPGGGIQRFIQIEKAIDKAGQKQQKNDKTTFLSPGLIYNSPLQPQIIPNNTTGNTIAYGGGTFSRENQQTTNVTFGDIIIHTNATNSEEVGQAVEEHLVSVLMGQSLLINAEGTVT